MYKQPVEQAVFTWSESAGTSGYRVTARSFAVGEADVHELAAWGPSNDSLLAMDSESESLNFHPLPSGAFCISKSLASGGICPDGNERIFTHCLIVPPETLAKFGNNPFAIDRAASLRDMWLKDDPPDAELEPLWLPSGASPVDETLLGKLASDPGSNSMAALVQTARDGLFTAVGGAPSPRELIAGLLACIPPECHTEFSFSTGMKFSPRRPFRVAAVSGDPAERCWVAGYPNVSILDLQAGREPRSIPLDGWGQFIKRSLATGQFSFLSSQMAKRRFNLALDDLPALGLQLQEELDGLEMGRRRPVEKPAPADSSSDRRGHAAHPRFSKGEEKAATATAIDRSTILAKCPPEVLDKLENLDDVVYEAINGQPEAISQLRSAWPSLLSGLDEELVAESREQYLRYALSVWQECAESNGVRQSDRAIQALDVLCLLFDDVR